MTNRIKVYRLEKDYLGPFVSAQGIAKHNHRREGLKKGDNPNDFVYACPSREKFAEYFDWLTGYDVFKSWLDSGYEIKEYTVPKRLVRIVNEHEVMVHMSCLPNYPRNNKELVASSQIIQDRINGVKQFSDSGHV